MDSAEIIILVFIILFALIFAVLFYKLNSTVTNKLSQIDVNYSTHLISSQNILIGVTEKLTELKSAAQNIKEVGENIQSLQDILQPPKLRGGLGELLLERILEEVLPPNCYKLQYKFQTGNIVDAVVKLKDSQLLTIDSKFPLSSFSVVNNGAKEIQGASSQFKRDVKKHIDSISSKYILPDEGTLGFALMYIPAENIYYEIILKEEDITQYARSKNVIPVSPLSLYSYLSVVLIGLRGMEIEKDAKRILNQILNIKTCFENFSEEFNVLGGHLNNAKSKYDMSRKALDNISGSLVGIEVKVNEK